MRTNLQSMDSMTRLLPTLAVATLIIFATIGMPAGVMLNTYPGAGIARGWCNAGGHYE